MVCHEDLGGSPCGTACVACHVDLDLGGSPCGTAYVACHVDFDLGGMPGGTLLLVLLLVYNLVSTKLAKSTKKDAIFC